MLKTSRRKIVTVEKRKNVCWKGNVDLKIAYANVYLQKQVIHEKFTQLQQKVNLGNDNYNHTNSFRNKKYVNEISVFNIKIDLANER